MTESIRERSTASDVSEETLKVLDAIRKPGEVFEGADKPVEPTKEVKPEEKPKEEPKVDPKPEEKPVEPKPEERPARSVPVIKFNVQRHELGETKAQLAAERAAKADLELKLKELSDKPTQENVDEVRVAAKKLAEKHGLDEEFVVELMEQSADLASKKASKSNIPADLEKTIAEFKAQTERSKAIEQSQVEDKQFEDSFGKVSTEFPELADPKVKEALKQLAFMEGYESTPLRAIALEYIHDNKPRKTAEESGKGRADVTDYENITDAQLKAMNREEATKFLAWQKQKHDYRTNSPR
jgi:hypothetical protein